MPRLSDLNIRAEKMGGVAFEDLPEQMGGFRPPPQPGPYIFQLPADLTTLWDVFDCEIDGKPAQRLNLIFDDGHPLVITQSPTGEETGQPFLTRLNNRERRRGKADDTSAPMVSDMDYFLAKGFGVMLPAERGTQEYHDAVVALATMQFGADIEWSWYCNDQRDIYTEGEDGTNVKVDGRKGCGSRYYEQQVPREEDGRYPFNIPCSGHHGEGDGAEPCGASVRAFANLTRFRQVG